jgi:phospholipase/carboxylesterase
MGQVVPVLRARQRWGPGRLCVTILPDRAFPPQPRRKSILSEVQYRAERRRIGSLDCVCVSPAGGEAVKALCVQCHGYGAGGDDLVGLGYDLLDSRTGEEPVMVVFPAALLSLASQGYGAGRAWWHLSIQRLLETLQGDQDELVRRENPPGIDEARLALTGTVQILLSETGLSTKSLLLGGFSQGAMLAMECACCGLEDPPGALALYSGCLIREEAWRGGAARLQHTRIVQSHGQADEILPLKTGQWLRDMLQSQGCQVEWLEFYGPHTICGEAIDRTASLLDELASA